MDYKKKNTNTDMEKGRGNKRARVARGSWNPQYGKSSTMLCANTAY
jgi:hypothetical protein